MRYYACEAMYNIAKVAKGEILVYFNSIFDQLCRVSSTLYSHSSPPPPRNGGVEGKRNAQRNCTLGPVDIYIG